MMSKPVLTVELKALQNRASEATQFLKSKLEGKMKTRGTQLQIEGAKTKEVKLLLHKFLHHQGLNHYRVLSQSGVLEVTPPEKHDLHPLEREGSPPTAAQTTPYYFPQAPVLTPERQKKAKPKHKHE
ncbi:hypothetical protein E6H31_05355 [Candidatus Bathyarchaeota archaeon]|nr:MAG: hypothetical protein E6H31_05355 [Candidatus Bathyarchaeota archaeon]